VRRALVGSEFVVCAEASDAGTAIVQARAHRPALCLLDVNMPGWGPAAAWEISARLPHSKIVMLTVSRDHADLFAALRGAVPVARTAAMPGVVLAMVAVAVLGIFPGLVWALAR
jgi:DNA-binding NarL/FixJ family response regulator